jgi:hypothetical protein
MVSAESSTTVFFSAAVSQILAREGHGAQTALAKRAKISVSYLNDLLAGRKPYWPDKIKERVAQVVGFSVSELLDIGETYVRDGVYWPHGKDVHGAPAFTAERTARIMQLAARDAGISMESVLFTASTVEMMLPQVLVEYKARALTDAKLYGQLFTFCAAICKK